MRLSQIRVSLQERDYSVKLVALLSLILAASTCTAQILPCRGPLSEQQLMELLLGKVPDGRMETFISACGITFAVTEQVLAHLQDAGATQALLDAIRQKGEEARLAQLRVKLGLASTRIEELPSNLSLNDARTELILLRGQVTDIEARLRSEYPDLQHPPDPDPVKDQFETTAQWQARVKRQRGERQVIDDRFATELRALNAPRIERISALLDRTYVGALKPERVSYNADRQLLYASIGSSRYRFSVIPELARVVFEHRDHLQVTGQFLKAERDQRSPGQVSLIDQITEQVFRSIGFSVDVSGAWKLRGQREIGPIVRLDLTLEGEDLTGTAWRAESVRTTFTHGRIDNNNISFDIGEGREKWTFRGKISTDQTEIVFTVSNSALGYTLVFERSF